MLQVNKNLTPLSLINWQINIPLGHVWGIRDKERTEKLLQSVIPLL